LEQLARQAEAQEKAQHQEPPSFQALEGMAHEQPLWQVLTGPTQPPQEEVTACSHPWYVIIAGVPVAAMTFAQLRRKAMQGTIRPRDRLYYAPKNAHLRAIDLPGIFPAAVFKKKPSRFQKLFRRNKPQTPPVIPQVPQVQFETGFPGMGPPPAGNSDLTELLRALDGLS
jgi:hypothetical protein